MLLVDMHPQAELGNEGLEHSQAELGNERLKRVILLDWGWG